VKQTTIASGDRIFAAQCGRRQGAGRPANRRPDHEGTGYRAVRDRLAAVPRAGRDLAARGCKALGYRLSGPAPADHICVKHLRDSLRVVVAFEGHQRAWILLVGRHDVQDPVLNVYAELYRLLGVEPAGPASTPRSGSEGTRGARRDQHLQDGRNTAPDRPVLAPPTFRAGDLERRAINMQFQWPRLTTVSPRR
jgi:hypothetical protein